MIRGLRIKQTAHAGLAKVPHNVNAWECAVSGVLLSQNTGLWFLAALAGQARWKLFRAKNVWSYCSALTKAHIFFVFITIQVFPAH